MHEITGKEILTENTVSLRIRAPEIAAKAAAGQFVIVRAGEEDERIPLTIADYDRGEGTLTLVVQEAGYSTKKLARLEAGDEMMDVAGPLGNPSEITKAGTVVCVGGGVGIAPVFPIARAFLEAGNAVTAVLAARTGGLVFWEDKFRQAGIKVLVCTDDGSYGTKGLATDALEDMIAKGPRPALVVAVGPAVMMKAVSLQTKKHGIRTIVSLNPIMVDGTGMCGGCRVSVGGRTYFACVDGPEFDGHQVDFDELISRQRFYAEEEKKCMGKNCKLSSALGS